MINLNVVLVVILRDIVKVSVHNHVPDAAKVEIRKTIEKTNM